MSRVLVGIVVVGVLVVGMFGVGILVLAVAEVRVILVVVDGPHDPIPGGPMPHVGIELLSLRGDLGNVESPH